MTKDDPPSAGVAMYRSAVTEQGVEMLRINLDQPLTDQLVKHPRFAPVENDTWNKETGDGKRGGHWNDDKQKQPSNGFASSSSSSSSSCYEIMDLAMKKNSGALSNSERDKQVFGCGSTGKNSSPGRTPYNHLAPQSSDFDKFYKGSPPVDYIQNGYSVRDMQKSDVNRSHSNVSSRGLSKCSPGMSKCSPVPTNTTKGDSASSGLPPPPLRNYDGGHAGAKMASAFQQVESHLRDQTIPALYKSHPYPYGLPLMPPSTTGLFDYQSLSHPLLQPSEHHRSLIRAQSSSSSSSQTVCAGTTLSPYVLYSDNLMTHQLELLWQRKYPQHPVPPVWMLYQYMDELLRDTSRIPSREINPTPRDSFKVTPVPGAVPVVPTPVGAMSVERKRTKKQQKDKERFEDNKDVKMSDGRNVELLHLKQRNDCTDPKEWGKAEVERREPNQNGNAVDWHRLEHRHSHPDAQSQQRRELLIDESASSACDAVNQHFQESLLRLASQNHVDLIPRDATGISVLSRNHLEDQVIIEKQENIHGNGNDSSWKDGRYGIRDQRCQYGTSDDSNRGRYPRSSGASAMTQVTSRNSKTQYDIYGYQPQQSQAEKFHSTAREDAFLSKSEKANFKLQMHRQSTPNSSERVTPKKQHAFLAAESGKDVKDVHQDFRNSFNASTKVGDKSTLRGVSTKLLNGVKLSAGSQSLASPIPGSIVKDPRLGPSRLIASSPKPLPNIFYYPPDSGLEPVQPCQVSIEPVERWSTSSTLAPSNVADNYQSRFYVHPGSLPSGFSSFPQTSSAGFQAETYSKIQQGLIPNPLYFPGICELERGNYATLPNRTSAPDFHQARSFAKTSPLTFEPSESRATPGKRVKKEDSRESVKKPRVNAVPRLASTATGDDGEGLQRICIDSFKSFVEQAVYNAFIEDTDDGNESEKISSMKKLITDMEMEKGGRLVSGDHKNPTGPASKLSSKASPSKASPSSERSAAEALSVPSDCLKTRTSQQPVSLTTKLLPSMPPAKNWDNSEQGSDTLSTASSITPASDLPERGSLTSDATALPPSSPAQPSQIPSSSPNFPLPPSPPRASGASLHLKKAWLLRYSDNDQKTLSDASSSSFRDELDNQSSDCSKCSFTEKLSQSPCDSELTDVLKSVGSQPHVGDISCVEKDRQHEVSFASDDLGENGNSTLKIKELKRKATSETLATRYSKRARDSSTRPSPNKSELLNGHQGKRKTRAKYSTRLARMAERSAPNSPQVQSHDRECYDSKNTEENDESCSPVQSDSESRPSRLRKKTKGSHVQTRDHRDSDSCCDIQPKKTSGSFLQDGSCVKVAPRLTKCRECKAPHLQRNNPNTTSICKFYVFRKLQYNSKGVLSVAGFLEQSDAEEDDVGLWMPSKSKNLSLTPVQARYMITHLKEHFLFLLNHETRAVSHRSPESSDEILWRRPIEGVQETCDVCDAVLFDIHWTCAKCGFVACIECHDGYSFTKDSEDDQVNDENDWPACCVKRQGHEPDDLTMTRIIPCDVLTVMMQRLHELLESASEAKNELGTADDHDHDHDHDQPNATAYAGLSNQSVPNPVCDLTTNICSESQTTDSGFLQSLVPCGDSDKVQETVNDCAGASDAAAAAVESPVESGCSRTSTGSQEGGPAVGKLSVVPRVVLSRSEAEPNRSVKAFESNDKAICDSGLYGDVANLHHRFDGQQVLRLVNDTDKGAIDLFQAQWGRSMPVVVSNCNKRFQSSLWRPEVFAKRFSHLRVDLISCLTGAVHRFQSMEKFWTSSKHLLSSSSGKMAGLLQFKDWPLSDDWTGSLNEHHLDLRQALPFHCYTLSSGPFNLLSHLPEFFPQPDLTTRISVGHGNVSQNQVTLSKLQTNPVDFVNVAMHAENKDSDSESFEASVVELVKASGFKDDVTLVTKKPETIVAVWHTYQPKETGQIMAFLEKIHSGSASSQKGSSRDSVTDFGCYLDSALQEKLLRDFGVQPCVIVQCLGDAVFIPAMTFYQVKVIQDCISVSREFISPESIQSFFEKSLQPKWDHHKSGAKHDRQNNLQIKNLVYHTVKDCIAVLGDDKS